MYNKIKKLITTKKNWRVRNLYIFFSKFNKFFLIFKTVHKKTAKEDISPNNKEKKPALDNILFAPDFL